MYQDKQNLWSPLLHFRNGKRHAEWLMEIENGKTSIWWRDIIKNDNHLLCPYRWLTNNIVRNVGEGRKTLFWEERLLGEKILMEDFSRLYQLTTDEEVLIQSKSVEMGVSVWN